MSPSKNCIVVLAYNEENNIAEVLSKMPKGNDVYVVDDGSSDSTAGIARLKGAYVIRHAANMGYGVAVGTAFEAVLSEKYHYMVTLDGDGQHDPAEIPGMLKAIEETQVDYLIGSRILGEDYPEAPFFRKHFLPFYTWMISKISGNKITDSMSGFIAYRLDFFREHKEVLDELREYQYLLAELFIKFSRAGMRVGEKGIKMSKRASGKSYKGMVKFGLGVAWAIFHSSKEGKK